MEDGSSTDAANALLTPALEADHVHRVYDSIAPHFSHTRHHPWPLVVDFLAALPVGALVADVGCGNGKYLGVNPALLMVGSDRSVPLLRAGCSASSTKAAVNVFGGDALKLPLRSGSFDAAICIAVMHHLSTPERRLALLRELGRIIRPGGQLYVVAWAFEQDARSKRQFEQQDVMVEWKLQQKYARDDLRAAHARADGDRRWVVYERYCHVYRAGELEALVARTPGLHVVSSDYSRSNWCLRIERTQ